MAINELHLKIHSYESFLNEMAIRDEELKKVANFLQDFTDIKANLRIFAKIVNDLKTDILNDGFTLRSLPKNGNTILLEVKYTPNVAYIISIIENSYEKASTKIKKLYDKEVCPGQSLENVRFEVIIQIQENFLNRIHVPSGFPIVLQGLGLGKMLYKKAIKELGYISTNRLDRTADAIMVWDSLRKEKDVYSFVIDEEMLCIDSLLPYSKIETLLLRFFHHKIISRKNGSIIDYILDTDFVEKYNEKYKKSDLKYL